MSSHSQRRESPEDNARGGDANRRREHSHADIGTRGGFAHATHAPRGDRPRNAAHTEREAI